MKERMELPDGWVETIVKAVAKNIQYGYTESSSKEDIGPKFLRITDIQDNKVDWQHVPYCKINEIDKANYLLSDGDLVFARTGATVGKSFLIKGNIPEAIFASYLIRLRFSKDILDKYVWYYFQSPLYWNQIINKQVGTGQPNVNGTTLAALSICIPPLPEQHRIVAAIESLFSSLDRGIASLKTAQQQLKIYRQAVLKWAFEGKLTNEEVKDGELPEGWGEKKISDVAETYGGYAFKSGEFLNEGKFQVLRMGNIKQGLLRYEENAVFINNVDQTILKKALLKPNDLVITQTGTKGKRDYGFTALIPKNNLLLNQRIAAIRCNQFCSPKFLLYYTWTDKFKNQFFSNETGNVGQGNVGMKAITDSIILIPSLSEQQNIVAAIESRLSVCDKLEETILQSLQQAEALRQSILKKAFAGQLVPQDPNDEPASVLLERIRAERAAATHKNHKNHKHHSQDQ